MCGVLCMSASHHKATEFRGHVKTNLNSNGKINQITLNFQGMHM